MDRKRTTKMLQAYLEKKERLRKRQLLCKQIARIDANKESAQHSKKLTDKKSNKRAEPFSEYTQHSKKLNGKNSNIRTEPFSESAQHSRKLTDRKSDIPTEPCSEFLSKESRDSSSDTEPCHEDTLTISSYSENPKTQHFRLTDALSSVSVPAKGMGCFSQSKDVRRVNGLPNSNANCSQINENSAKGNEKFEEVNPLIKNSMIEDSPIQNPTDRSGMIQNPLIEGSSNENQNPMTENPTNLSPMIENPLKENLPNSIKLPLFEERVLPTIDDVKPNSQSNINSPMTPIRKKDVIIYRRSLPITYHEPEILNLLKTHSVIFIQGTTGCGKTTQIPQLILHTPTRKLCVTVPRRILAINLSNRLNYELNSPISGYKIKNESTVNSTTKIEVMTEGVLLREIQEDFLLLKYSHVVLDEVHERSAQIDLLISLISRIAACRLKMNNKLVVVLMSACDLPESILNIFSVPVGRYLIESGSFKVYERFEKLTDRDYVTASFTKIDRIIQASDMRYRNSNVHKSRFDNNNSGVKSHGKSTDHFRLNYNRQDITSNHSGSESESYDGSSDHDSSDNNGSGESVSGKYVSGKSISAKYVSSKFTSSKYVPDKSIFAKYVPVKSTPGKCVSGRPLPRKSLSQCHRNSNFDSHNPSLNSLNLPEGIKNDISSHILCFLPQKEDIHKLYKLLSQKFPKIEIHKLHSATSLENQNKIFSNSPRRKIILSTNIAESSLTIPSVEFVIDTGVCKTKKYLNNDCYEYDIEFISKQSAEQRKGRCGRTRDGVCFRMYSHEMYEAFEERFCPGILKDNLDSMMLYLLNLGIEDLSKFPYVTRPPEERISESLSRLAKLKAIRIVKDMQGASKYEDRDNRNCQIARIYNAENKNSQQRVSSPCTRNGQNKSLNLSTANCSQISYLGKKNDRHYSNYIKITTLGKILALFPVEPKYARLLFTKKDFTKAMLLITSILSVEPETKKLSEITPKWVRSDLIAKMILVQTFYREKDGKGFCEENGVIYQQFREVVKLYEQLSRIYYRLNQSQLDRIMESKLDCSRHSVLDNTLESGINQSIESKTGHTLESGTDCYIEPGLDFEVDSEVQKGIIQEILTVFHDNVAVKHGEHFYWGNTIVRVSKDSVCIGDAKKVIYSCLIKRGDHFYMRDISAL